MKIGCIIMASGMSRRFGSNKLLQDFHGEPVMTRILNSVRAASLDAAVVVTRHAEVALMAEQHGIPRILHQQPLRSDTVQLGMEYLLTHHPDLDGILFAASDQPCLRAESIIALCQAFQAAPDYIYRLSCGDTVGNPVLFPRCTFPELEHLPAGKGGGAVIKAHPDLLRLVTIADPRELIDIDTPDVLRALLQSDTSENTI